MNTSVVYVDTQSESHETSEDQMKLLSSYGVLKLIYRDLRVEDDDGKLKEMIRKIQDGIGLEGMKGNVLIIGTLTSKHCTQLDQLLDGRPNWTFISTIATSTRMKSLRSGFSVHYNDIHLVSTMILLTESMYPQILVVTDDMFGIDLYHAYSNSMTSQTVKLQVMTDRSPSLDKIESYINSPKTVVVSAMLGSRYGELLDIIDHERMISLNPWRVDAASKRHLIVRPSTPFPEKFGEQGVSLKDMMEFCTRIRKIDREYNLGRSEFVQLWNQFTTDMKSSLTFFRNCEIDVTLNIPRIFGIRLVSNKRLIDDVDVELFNSRNCETFNQSVVAVYIRQPSKTPAEYWNNIEVIPTKLISIRDEETKELLYQRFSDSITDIGNDNLMIPHCAALSIRLDLSREVKSASLLKDIDIFTLQPKTETEYVIEESVEEDALDSLLSQDLEDIEFDADLDDLEYTIEPNLDFYHSIIA